MPLFVLVCKLGRPELQDRITYLILLISSRATGQSPVLITSDNDKHKARELSAQHFIEASFLSRALVGTYGTTYIPTLNKHITKSGVSIEARSQSRPEVKLSL